MRRDDDGGGEDLNDSEPKDDSEGSTIDSQSLDTVIHSSSMYRLLPWINLTPNPVLPPLALTVLLLRLRLFQVICIEEVYY
ncbi:unnamed protein product [Heligmosomoides polygyrus]|uniref:Uncharacterized protein n=1 Tax=Heligmosomoides polygyrus TaxID=6339 RepID=A0A183GSE7_HELPZ|nr:unnamed protein product [Heligmosomoides polygyrus]